MEVGDVARYEAILRRQADLTRRLSKSTVDAGNRLAVEAQELYLRLRETPEGRAAIEKLAEDPDRLVRLAAAAHCLKWNPEMGRAALEEIRDGGGQDGPGWDIAGFDAEWTLKTFEDGSLDLDWRTGVNADSWELVRGPEGMVPWDDPDTSAAWLWTLRNRATGESRELSVRVSWRGFDSVGQVPSPVTREAFVEKGRPGVTWFLNHTFDGWSEIIFHSQSRTPHGSAGRRQIARLPDS